MMVLHHARSIIGRREFTRSMGTSDKPQAKREAHPVVDNWYAQLEAIHAGTRAPIGVVGSTTLTTIDIEEAALLIGYEEADRRTKTLVQAKAQSGAAAFAALGAEFDRRHSEAVRRRYARDHGYWQERARHYVSKVEWNLPEDSEAFGSFVEALATCGTDLSGRARAIMAGADDNYTPSNFVQQASRRRSERALLGEGLTSLFESYATEKLTAGKKRRDTHDQDRKVIGRCADFVGRDQNLRSIPTSDAREWRNVLRLVPAAFGKTPLIKDILLLQRVARKLAERVGFT